jgi:hypothetical protein
MSKVREIPWPRILAEGAAIVVSILLAFSIQAWWDEYQEERQLYEILEALEDAFSGNLSQIDDNIEVVSANYELLNRFIQIGPENIEKIPMGDRFGTLRAIWAPDTRNLNTGLLLKMLDAERLKSLRNAELQQSIAHWQSWLEQLNQRRALIDEGEVTIFRALALRQSLWPYLVAIEPSNQPVLSTELLREIRDDQEVMALVVEKAHSAELQLFYFRHMSEQIRIVLDLLGAVLPN